MTPPKPAQIATRKQPKQARSSHLVEAILEAASKLLAEEGASNFTTARVAERAGVSVGSLYQYFPNKASILFRLQSDEWRETSELFGRVLRDEQRRPLDRLRTLVHRFIVSECEEATLRRALNDSAPLYRAAPEAREARQSSSRALRRFIVAVLPSASEQSQERAFELVLGTLTGAGKQFSETPRTPSEIEAYADAMADMFCLYLEALNRRL